MKEEKRLALWLCKRPPTPEELAEISENGHELVAVEEGIRLAGVINFFDTRVLGDANAKLADLIRQHGADVIYGAYPATLLGVFFRMALNLMSCSGGGTLGAVLVHDSVLWWIKTRVALKSQHE